MVSVFKTRQVTFTHGINLWPFQQIKDLRLRNSLFGAAKLTKKADIDK